MNRIMNNSIEFLKNLSPSSKARAATPSSKQQMGSEIEGAMIPTVPPVSATQHIHNRPQPVSSSSGVAGLVGASPFDGEERRQLLDQFNMSAEEKKQYMSHVASLEREIARLQTIADTSSRSRSANSAGLGKNNMSLYNVDAANLSNCCALRSYVANVVFHQIKIFNFEGRWTHYDPTDIEHHPLAAKLMKQVTVPTELVGYESVYYSKMVLPQASAKLSGLRGVVVKRCRDVFMSK